MVIKERKLSTIVNLYNNPHFIRMNYQSFKRKWEKYAHEKETKCQFLINSYMSKYNVFYEQLFFYIYLYFLIFSSPNVAHKKFEETKSRARMIETKFSPLSSSSSNFNTR